jgi:hypothetical protein
LVLDAYDDVADLDAWLREELLPQLPAETIVAVASRSAPPARWLADPGWRRIVRGLPLGNLSATESEHYLALRLPAGAREPRALARVSGNPLWLALAADILDLQAGDLSPSFPPEPTLDDLAEALLRATPGSAQRDALHACAVVRTVSPALLAELLDASQVHESFTALSGLSCVDVVAGGIVLHPEVRRVILRQLRTGAPTTYRTLYLRARTAYLRRFAEPATWPRETVVAEYAFLHRDHPVLSPYRVFGREYAVEGLTTDWLEASDRATLRAVVLRHEGEPSAALFDHWLAHQPHGVLVVRDPQRQPVGFLMTLALHEALDDDLALDPGTRQVLAHARRTTPLRSGQAIVLFRFWMAKETYQDLSPIQNLLFVAMLSQVSAVAPLAFSGLACSDADRWVALLGLGGSTRLPDADFVVGGRTYGVYGRDWRWQAPPWPPDEARPAAPPVPNESAARVPSPVPSAPLTHSPTTHRPAHRPTHRSPTSSSSPPPPAGQPLTDEQFAGAVREALRYYNFPDALRRSPLLQARIVCEQVGHDARADARVAALRTLVQEVVEAMRGSARLARFHRALHHTYLEPSESQERVAERLGLPFGTYRGHLRAGLDLVIDALRQREQS